MKKYIIPEIDVVTFDVMDIIQVSGQLDIKGELYVPTATESHFNSIKNY